MRQDNGNLTQRQKHLVEEHGYAKPALTTLLLRSFNDFSGIRLNGSKNYSPPRIEI
jgi:hypothetical protein